MAAANNCFHTHAVTRSFGHKMDLRPSPARCLPETRQPKHNHRATTRVHALASSSAVSVGCPYTRLGVQPGASEEAVKSAYRKLAKQLHPDICKAPDAEAQFIALQQAYEMLSGKRTSVDGLEPSVMPRGNRQQWVQQVVELKRRPSAPRRGVNKTPSSPQKSPSAREAERRQRLAAQLACLKRNVSGGSQ